MTLQQKIQFKPYAEKDFSHLKGLTGISDKTLEIHLGLYAGYVKNTNTLNEKVIDLTEKGLSGQPEYAELKRRYGWEYNGMRLHEYYFGNLKAGGSELKEGSAIGKLMAENYSSVDVWKNDFMKVGAMRGVGWAILFQDPFTKQLSNHWISSHEEGNIAGFAPILVMDVWEHAFLLDYKPSERPKYIEAFFSNIDWTAVEARLLK
ncbi:MAG: Fe-Mn family superoxide dismutase [Candidatus Obscuribacterales bacterium]|jgi:Fe-Mn family superoxide dismutase|nr:Fe-Mn family superoxide dismutase [Candidatus Obscuribacterales bacterium]